MKRQSTVKQQNHSHTLSALFVLMLQSLEEGSQGELRLDEHRLVDVVSATGLVAGQVGNESLDGCDAQVDGHHLSVGVVGVLCQLVLGHLDQRRAVVDHLVGALSGGVVVVHLQGDLQLLLEAVLLCTKKGRKIG